MRSERGVTRPSRSLGNKMPNKAKIGESRSDKTPSQYYYSKGLSGRIHAFRAWKRRHRAKIREEKREAQVKGVKGE